MVFIDPLDFSRVPESIFRIFCADPHTFSVISRISHLLDIEFHEFLDALLSHRLLGTDVIDFIEHGFKSVIIEH